MTFVSTEADVVASRLQEARLSLYESGFCRFHAIRGAAFMYIKGDCVAFVL